MVLPSSQPNTLPFTADCCHLWANYRSLVSRGTSRNKGLQPGTAELGSGKKTGLDQLPQTPVAMGLAVLPVNGGELCLHTSEGMELTTRESGTVWRLGENRLATPRCVNSGSLLKC